LTGSGVAAAGWIDGFRCALPILPIRSAARRDEIASDRLEMIID
jgi:hypothetical protein